MICWREACKWFLRWLFAIRFCLFLNCHYIDMFFGFFRMPSFLFLFQRLRWVCEHKCVCLTIGNYKAVQISYSQKFPLQNGHGISCNTVLSLLFSKEVKQLLCHIDGEDCHFVEIKFPVTLLASMTLSDMHVVEVQVPFLLRHWTPASKKKKKWRSLFVGTR